MGDARGRVWREWRFDLDQRWIKGAMPWTWECHEDHSWGDYPGAASSGISMYHWDALDAMNEHLEAHRVR